MSELYGMEPPLGRPEQHVINAMVLDDSAFDRKRIRRMNDGLDTPMRLTEVPSISDMCMRMNDEAFDLILVDYNLSEGDGLEALDKINQHQNNSGAATVMITGNEGCEVAVSAMKLGCCDFLTKPELTPARFKTTVVEVMAHTRTARLERAHVMDLALPDELSQLIHTVVNNTCFKKALADTLSAVLKQAVPPVSGLSNAQEVENLEQLLINMKQADEFIF